MSEDQASQGLPWAYRSPQGNPPNMDKGALSLQFFLLIMLFHKNQGACADSTTSWPKRRKKGGTAALESLYCAARDVGQKRAHSMHSRCSFCHVRQELGFLEERCDRAVRLSSVPVADQREQSVCEVELHRCEQSQLARTLPRESDHSPDVEVVVAEGKQGGLELGGSRRRRSAARAFLSAGPYPASKFREHADNARGLAFAE